jgi:hypothetical protein
MPGLGSWEFLQFIVMFSLQQPPRRSARVSVPTSNGNVHHHQQNDNQEQVDVPSEIDDRDQQASSVQSSSTAPVVIKLTNKNSCNAKEQVPIDANTQGVSSQPSYSEQVRHFQYYNNHARSG